MNPAQFIVCAIFAMIVYGIGFYRGWRLHQVETADLRAELAEAQHQVQLERAAAQALAKLPPRGEQ